MILAARLVLGLGNLRKRKRLRSTPTVPGGLAEPGRHSRGYNTTFFRNVMQFTSMSSGSPAIFDAA